jgi:hypothetical protein
LSSSLNSLTTTEKLIPFTTGSIVTCDKNIDVEINHRINKCYHGLQDLHRSELLRKDTKCKICKTLIKPFVPHGSEGWTLTKLNEEKLKNFQRKILRKIYDRSNANGVWRLKYNEALNKLF